MQKDDSYSKGTLYRQTILEEQIGNQRLLNAMEDRVYDHSRAGIQRGVLYGVVTSALTGLTFSNLSQEYLIAGTVFLSTLFGGLIGIAEKNKASHEIICRISKRRPNLEKALREWANLRYGLFS